MKRFIVFGYGSQDDRPKTRHAMSQLAAALGDETGLDVAITPVRTSARLATLIDRGDIDVAWLNPITLVSLARNRIVRPVVSVARSDREHYRCAIIVRSGSPVQALRDLRGKVAAWVDRHSASGFVLPRIELARHRVLPASFKAERFVGSHAAVVRSVASGRADFGGTFLHVRRDGSEHGAWSDIGLASSIQGVARFGDVPPDAIAVRYALGRDLALALRAAFRALSARPEAEAAFDARGFVIPRRATYEALRASVFQAYRRGLLDIAVNEEGDENEGGATEERRPLDAPARQRFASATRRKSDGTEEIDAADVLDVVER